MQSPRMGAQHIGLPKAVPDADRSLDLLPVQATTCIHTSSRCEQSLFIFQVFLYLRAFPNVVSSVLCAGHGTFSSCRSCSPTFTLQIWSVLCLTSDCLCNFDENLLPVASCSKLPQHMPMHLSHIHSQPRHPPRCCPANPLRALLQDVFFNAPVASNLSFTYSRRVLSTSARHRRQPANPADRTDDVRLRRNR